MDSISNLGRTNRKIIDEDLVTLHDARVLLRTYRNEIREARERIAEAKYYEDDPKETCPVEVALDEISKVLEVKKK